MSAIEVLNRTRKVLNTNPVIKAHLDSYCFYLENEGRGKTVNKFGKEVIKFLIEHEGKEKTMEVGTNQYDYLKILATNKPLVGKTFKHQRQGSTQKDTRRTIKVI